ncbi:hypothetical protein, partial [Serratia marcescens]|uniref:hypothetical protein n=1 Tax=Serratia marcescens TaxID=615 RepID=UPI0011E7908B
MLPSGRCRDILIISDDRYFIYGLENYINEKKKTASSVDSVTAKQFISQTMPYQDFQKKLVIVSIKDLNVFHQVVDKLNGKYWRV